MLFFALNQITGFIILHIIAYLEGRLVINFGWRVNYTRKINHFFIFFFPYVMKLIFPFDETLTTQVLIAIVGLSSLTIYIKPIRERVKIFKVMFAAFDRPEDRPHTLKWLSTQYLFTYLAAIPVWFVCDKMGHQEAIPIIILINALGDGLAEPIGVTWGKHKYEVKALFTKSTFTRSIEGSACVFLVALITVVVYKNHFELHQFIVALVLVPIGATLAEAKSPHTWDSPFIFLVTGIILIGVYSI